MSELHQAVRLGEIERVRQLLDEGTPVDLYDDHSGYTPLMQACVSSETGLELVQLLIDRGANLEAVVKPTPVELPDLDSMLEDAELPEEVRELMSSVESLSQDEPDETSLLALATGEASVEKLRLLFENGANPAVRSTKGYTLMILACCALREDIIELLLSVGAPIDGETDYAESALSVLSNRGRFDLVERLLEAGADPSVLKWTPLHRAVVLGSPDDVIARLEAGDDPEAIDRWDRTAVLLAIHANQREKAEILLARGANLEARGRCGKPALFYPIDEDEVSLLKWLLDQGLDPDPVDDFETTALMTAAESGSVDCFLALSEAGADWSRKDHLGETIIEKAADPRIVDVLVSGGCDPSQMETETLRNYIGLGTVDELPVTRAEFESGRQQRFGRTNPERMEVPFWQAMVRNGWSAYQAAQQFGHDSFSRGEPVWCHDRFGMSLTALPDGRWVQIAGEHEDHYDPDFCIYNDVIVHDGKGGFEILGYPEDVFPPTDFHSATLVVPWIYLIGNLGYPETREAFHSRTPVFRFHLDTGEIERIETTGESPGWIHQHEAVLVDDRILIAGGKRLTVDESGEIDINPQTGSWALCLRTFAWQAG